MVPRLLHRDEQLLRTERLSAMGLVDFVHPTDVGPERLYDEVTRLLVSPLAPLEDARAQRLIRLEGAAGVAAFCDEAVAAMPVHGGGAL